VTEAQTIDALIREAARVRGPELALSDAPNRETFFSGEPLRLTWAQVDDAVDTVADHFADLGVGLGSIVGVQLPNVVELVLGILACSRVGAVVAPFPIQHRAHELRQGIAAAGVDLMITGARPDRPDQLHTVASVLAEFDGASLVVVGEAAEVEIDGKPVEQLNMSSAGDAHGASPHHPDPDDLVSICWTSGTTGTPKGVPRTHAMWLASGRFQVDELAITAADRILCPFPVVNMAGIGGMLVPWAITGSALHLHQPLDLQVFLGQLQSERITYTVVPPPLLNMLLANEAMLDSIDLSHIRTIGSGSAPLDPWMVQGWQERGIEIANIFGSNEGAALLSTRAAVPDPIERARYFPIPTRPGIEIKVVDQISGETITEIGRPGELRFRGDTVFDGYLDSTGEEFDDKRFYRTGDIFELAGTDEPPRLLRFVDRAKDIIIRGGMNISAAEVESIVSGLGSVAECAAVAYPDTDLGERVGVFVVPTEGHSPTLEEVAAHVREQEVASYKIPERLEIVTELPRNVLGKVVKSELRARWSEAD